MAFDGVSAIGSRDATALFYYSPPQKMEHKKPGLEAARATTHQKL